MRGITISALAGALSLAALTRLPSALLYNAGRQPSTVTVTVLDAGARYPLANADVIDLATNQHHFTDEHGQVRLPWPSDGQLRLRVRQVGYQPVARTLSRATASDEATTFAMSKVAYVMSPVKATSHCATTEDSASLALSVSSSHPAPTSTVPTGKVPRSSTRPPVICCASISTSPTSTGWTLPDAWTATVLSFRLRRT